MNLKSTAVYSLITSIVRVINGLLLNKLIAFYLGPSGFALYSQLINVIQVFLRFTNPFDSGLIKYIAEFKEKNKYITLLKNGGLSIYILITILIIIVINLFPEKTSYIFFNKTHYYNYCLWISYFLFFWMINNFIFSLLNADTKFKEYYKAQIVLTFINLIYVGLCTYYYRLNGAIFSIISSQAILFIYLIFIVNKTKVFDLKKIRFSISKKIVLLYSPFIIISLITGISLPLALIIIRKLIESNLGWEAVGLWQSVWKVSEIYLMFFTSLLSVYLLPRFSKFDNCKIYSEILYIMKYLIPIVIISSIIIYYSRFIIIDILYSENFLSSEVLYFAQFTGVLFRIISLVLTTYFIAKKLTYVLLLTELGYFFSFIILCYVLFLYTESINSYVNAFAISSFVYLILSVFFAKTLLKVDK